MDELTTLHSDPIFLRREAIQMGYDDRALRAAVRGRVLHRIRFGAYTPYHVWRDADPTQRHHLSCAAVGLTHGHRVAFSHTSGAVENELRLHRPNLDRVHVTRLDGGPSRVIGDVVYHSGAWTPDDIVQKGDLLLMRPVRSGLEAASLTNVENGMVILDSLLDLDLGDEDDIRRTYEAMEGSPRTQHLRITVRLTRRGAQSVGESRSRFLCWSQHLPPPELQFEVFDSQGRLIGTTDFAWPDYGVLGEFDGKIKYGRLLKPGQRVEDVLFAEKQREDLLREVTGFLMIRLIWADLARPMLTGARIRSQLTRGLDLTRRHAG